MHDADTDDDLLGFLAQKKRDMAKLQEAAWAAQEQAETVAQLRRKMEFLDRLAYGDDPRDGSPERGVEASSLSSVDRVRFGLTANFEDAMLTRRTPLTWQENAEMTWGAFSSAQLAVHSDELAWNCGARGGNVSLGALNIPLAGHTSVRLGSPEKLRDLGPPGSPIGASSCLSPQDRVRFGLDNCPPLAAWARPATPRTPRTPVRSPVPRPRSRDELSPAPVSVSPIFRTRRSQSTPYLDEGGSRAGSPTFLSKSDRARFGLDKPRRDVGVDDLYDEARPRGLSVDALRFELDSLLAGTRRRQDGASTPRSALRKAHSRPRTPSRRAMFALPTEARSTTAWATPAPAPRLPFSPSMAQTLRQLEAAGITHNTDALRRSEQRLQMMRLGQRLT
eukprot:TRINITY_DN16147_c0_g1_i1.p1 TRINITY_DN16147_c0_g1~~TRINITY_DN16147_c0_g1_i1.p1  ORF type:complete len:392 (+),score=86.81 TRINITY_DN16147_c0_g1_i1:85-1260(+)